MIKKIRDWSHKVLPSIYDDSLSYYEVLNKISAKCNEVIDAVNENTEKVEEAVAAAQDAQEAAEAAQESAEQSAESLQYIVDHFPTERVVLNSEGGYLTVNSDVFSEYIIYRDYLAITLQFGTPFLCCEGTVKAGTYLPATKYKIASFDESIYDYLPRNFSCSGIGILVNRDKSVDYQVEIIASSDENGGEDTGIFFKIFASGQSVTLDYADTLYCNPIAITSTHPRA